MSVSLIIAAGGISRRFSESFGSAQPAFRDKLLYPLQGMPLLAYTLSKFQDIPQIDEIFVAASDKLKSSLAHWKKDFGLQKVIWVRGGKSRAESVWRGLRKTNPRNPWIMVHDGARPLIEKGAIAKMIRAGNNKKLQGIILAQKIVPTVKMINLQSQEILGTLDRGLLAEAQTPQMIRRDILVQAYRDKQRAFTATDEAALAEAVGATVKVMLHGAWNPKVTSAQDAVLVNAYLKESQGMELRVGFGTDLHRLVPGRKLWLGGVKIPSEAGALGHSDGDVILHAITDAIYGAIAEGDIGEHFSDKDKKYKDQNSSLFLKSAVGKAAQKGWEPCQIDTVIMLERPKLKAYKQKICRQVAALLGISAENVSVKAKTAEGLGDIGEGRALSCQALVVMKRSGS